MKAHPLVLKWLLFVLNYQFFRRFRLVKYSSTLAQRVDNPVTTIKLFFEERVEILSYQT